MVSETDRKERGSSLFGRRSARGESERAAKRPAMIKKRSHSRAPLGAARVRFRERQLEQLTVRTGMLALRVEDMIAF